jgi:hypothetical protein
MQPLHDEMAANCRTFFEGIDLDANVVSILAQSASMEDF